MQPRFPEPAPGDVAADDLRRIGRQVADAVADYHAALPDRVVIPRVDPAEVAALFADELPEDGASAESLVLDWQAGGHTRGGDDMLMRTLSFSYGVVAYVIFLATFLYAVGFIGNFGVPRTLDGVPTEPLAKALAIDVALMALFAVQHSVMARKWFKDRWTRVVPPPVERSTYVLFSSLALMLLFWQWQPLGGEVWSVENPAGRLALRILFAFGWALVLVATFLINHFDLFGLRQVWLHLRGRPYTGLRFRTPGPYRLVRHPLYVGWLFAFWMTPTMTLSHFLFAAVTTAYILVAIRFEERDLVRIHGTAYEEYRRSVPMLVPSARPASGTAAAPARTADA